MVMKSDHQHLSLTKMQNHRQGSECQPRSPTIHLDYICIGGLSYVSLVTIETGTFQLTE